MKQHITFGVIMRKYTGPTKEVLEMYLSERFTYTNIARKYGVSDSCVKKWFKRFGIEVEPRKSRSLTSILRELTKQELEDFIERHSSFKNIFDELGMRGTGSSYNILKEVFENNDLDHTIFKKKDLEIRKNQKGFNRINNEDMFVENSNTSRSSVKRRILRETLIKYECSECGINDQWNGKTISLQLDHINGEGNDNRLENLRFLCPNCHSQTETFSGKHKKPKSKKSKHHPCIDCEKLIWLGSERCNSCYDKSRQIAERPDLDTLLELIVENGYRSVGRKYGVSDVAIRKWVKAYGVEPPTKKNKVR
jgi:transposase-like protein/5-methylcytosine-specific restriction endonuclease McrA